MSNKYKVWDCKIVVPYDAELPNGFDSPPRSAAIEAVLDAGIEVIACSSGWGGTLSKKQIELIEEPPYQPHNSSAPCETPLDTPPDHR